MKKNKRFKKLSAIIMAFAMLVGILPTLGFGITAKAATNPVQLYCVDFVMSRYGYSQYNIYIQVEGASAVKKAVYVHYEATNDGDWEDVQAGYITTIDGNKEIWKATVSGFGLGDEFTIKYVGDNTTYWDNNNGKNYTYNDILGVANIESIRLPYQSPSNYKIEAAVKNLGLIKTVRVKYTVDNWNTYQWKDLSYVGPISGTDAETWEVTLNLDSSQMDSFQYCLSYEVNGQTYWDNNFGANYNSSYYRPY